MNIKLADVFWILLNKVNEIVIYIDDGDSPVYKIINKDTDVNSILEYMNMYISYMGRDKGYSGDLIFRVILTNKEV